MCVTSHAASHLSSGERITSAAPQWRRGMGALHGAQQGVLISDEKLLILMWYFMKQNRLEWRPHYGELGKLRLCIIVRIPEAAVQDDKAAVRHQEANLQSTAAANVEETNSPERYDFRKWMYRVIIQVVP